MFKRNILRNRVMSYINDMLEDAEENLADDVKALEEKLKTDKEALIETYVKKILGKVI